MPHTSRKKYHKPPPKRLQITDSSGWTHIAKGTSFPRRQQRQHLLSSLPNATGFFQPAEIPPGLTTEKVQKDFQQCLKVWKASTCFHELKAILERRVLASNAVEIDRCVCLGLGSFTGGKTAEASMYELVALVSALEIVCASCLLFAFRSASLPSTPQTVSLV